MAAGTIRKNKKRVPGTRVLRDGTYEVILVVPADCRERVGKKNLTRRLGTSRYVDAVRLAPPILREFERMIEAARLGEHPSADAIDPRKAVQAVDQWKLAELARAELRAFNQRDEEIPDATTRFAEYRDFLVRHHELRDGLSKAGRWTDISQFDTKLIAALSSQGVRISREHPAMERLRPIFQAAWYDVVKYEDNLRNGTIRPGEIESTATSSSIVAPTHSQTGESTVTVWSAFVGWRSKRERHGQDAGKSSREFETQINRFIDVHGDLPLDKITRRHCIEFRDLMAQYPAHVPSALRREPIRTVVAQYTAAGAGPYKRLSAKTLNEKVFAAVRAVFADAVNDSENNLVNPMLNISVQEAESVSPSKLRYTDDEIGNLFSCAIFRGTLVSDNRAGGEAQKWIPLLAAYTGARLEELGQLAVTDVKAEEGIRHIHFQERYDGVDPGYLRSLKNKASHRKVPIHSALLELGFLDFVEGQRRAGHIHLFPLLRWRDAKKRDKSDKVTAYWSKWWSGYSRVVVSDTRKSFHSFRHTFKSSMRNAGVAKALHDALTGHASSDESDNYGRDQEGQGFALPILADAIERLSHPKIDLRALRRT